MMQDLQPFFRPYRRWSWRRLARAFVKAFVHKSKSNQRSRTLSRCRWS